MSQGSRVGPGPLSEKHCARIHAPLIQAKSEGPQALLVPEMGTLSPFSESSAEHWDFMVDLSKGSLRIKSPGGNSSLKVGSLKTTEL